jgi:hypothetical protein
MTIENAAFVRFSNLFENCERLRLDLIAWEGEKGYEGFAYGNATHSLVGRDELEATLDEMDLDDRSEVQANIVRERLANLPAGTFIDLEN